MNLPRLTAMCLTPALAASITCSYCLATEPPDRYVLDYPMARTLVPPVEGFFDEVARTTSRVGPRTFRHRPNGGYGLPVRDRVGGKHLLHLGADVGWYRVGDPVFAVGDGLVRVVQVPVVQQGRQNSQNQPTGMQWGGVVAIEHRLPGDSFVTTVYGHLDTKLLVSKGDIVTAGQTIGAIGATRVNGGYKPHLHFGVREGRIAEKGRRLPPINVDGQLSTLTIEKISEQNVLFAASNGLPEQLRLTIGDRTFTLQKREEYYETDAEILWHIQPIDFAIVGYGLSTDGWRDPVQFLKNSTWEQDDEIP